MKNLLLSILLAIDSLFGVHSSASQPATRTGLSLSVQTQETNTEVATAASNIPDLFLNYSIVYDGGTSTNTAESDLSYRLNNTYVKNKVTGATTPLLSPTIYGGRLLDVAEVMDNTLYAAILTTPIPGNIQQASINLWKSTNNGQPTLLYNNIRIFAASGDGYVAATDGSGQNVVILSPQGSLIQTIHLSQVDFCSAPEDGEGIDLANWSGHNVWLQCGYSDNSPASTYLEINADTFQITKNSKPPSALGM